MAKDRRTKDQKRKAKLKERQQRRPVKVDLTYEGEEYRKPRWALLMQATDVAVYETLVMTERRLTNSAARQGFTDLILSLRAGKPATLEEHEHTPVFDGSDPIAMLNWNIRRAWTRYFAEHAPVGREHLIGMLRTLLYSIQAHGAMSRGGYLGFIERFLTAHGVRVERVSRQQLEERFGDVGFLDTLDETPPEPMAELPLCSLRPEERASQ